MSLTWITLRRIALAGLALAALLALGTGSAGAAEGWLESETLATGTTGDERHTTFAFGAGGAAALAYPRADGHLIVRYRPPGGPWSADEDLGASTTWNVAPTVAVGPDGTVAAIARRDNARWVSVRRADGTWEAPRAVPDDFSTSSLAVGPHGEVAIAYTPHYDYYDRPFSVYERDAEGAWTRTAIDTAVVGGRPNGVGYDAEGTLTAAWVRPAPSGATQEEIVAAVRPAGGAWPDPAETPPAPVADARAIGSAAVRIRNFNLDVAPSGAAVVAWSDYDVGDMDGTSLVAAARRPTADAAWTGREAVEPTQPSLGDNGLVRAGVADDGTATIAWNYRGGDDAKVSIADRATADTAWTTQKVWAETYDAIDDRYHALDLDVNGRGDALVGWWVTTGTQRPVQSAVRPAGESWSASVRDHPVSTAFAAISSIDVGLDEQGNGLMGWGKYYGSAALAAGYDGAGPQLRAFTAPDGQVGDELAFAVDAVDVWGGVDLSAAQWTFGDGSTATGPAPTHVYASAGKFDVSVQVADDHGLTTTRSTRVTIAALPNVAPTAAFAATPDAVTAGDQVHFDATASSDPDGALAVFEWDFDGDGTPDSADGANDVQLVFDQAGDYPVTLRVQDDDGAWSAPVTHTVHVAAAVIDTPHEPGGDTHQPSVEAPPAPGTGPLVPSGPPVPTPPTPLAPPTIDPFAGLSITAPRFRVLSATRTRELPDVVGKHIDQARDVLDRKAYVRYDIDWARQRPRGRHPSLGEVIRQSPAGGRTRESGIGDFLRVRLVAYAGDKDQHHGCPAGMTKALKGKDFDLGRALIAETTCKVDELNFRLTAQGHEAQVHGVEVGKAHRGDRTLDLTVDVPRDPAEHDLFLVFSEYKPGNLHTFNDRWRLVKGKSSCFRVQVFDRDHALVQHADVRLDMTAVGGRAPERERTDANGEVKYCTPNVGSVHPDRSGTIDVVAFATGRNGETVFGASRITVSGSSATYRTPSGRTVVVKTGRYASTASARAHAAGWLDALAGLLGGAWATVATPFQQLGQGIQGVVSQINAAVAHGGTAHAADALGVVPGNLNPGRALSRAAGVIAAGGGNVIAAGGGNVIAAGGGNVIAAGGGNVIASGALNLIAKTGGAVIAAGGGNVISYGGGNVIAAGGGNVIAAGGGNVISYGGGNFAVGHAARTRAAQAERADGRAAAQDAGFRASGAGTVLRLPGKDGATMPVAEGMLLPTSGDFIVGVKDARRSDVVAVGSGIHVLIQAP